MAWTGVARAAISGITSLYPALLKPLNTENLGPTNFGALDAYATNIESLRSVSWHSDELAIAAGAPFITPDSLAWGHQAEASSGGFTLAPTYQSLTTSVVNGRLLYTVRHPADVACYIRGAKILSEHVGTAHTSLPVTPFAAEWYVTTPVGTTLIYESPAADTASPGAYDAAQSFEITIPSGSRPSCAAAADAVFTLALRAETGTHSWIGRRVRGVQFIFSKVA